MKFYKISEKDLISLLENSLRLDCLEYDGVDNWNGYMESREEFLDSYYKEFNIPKENEWLEFCAVAENLVKDYECIEE